jgi:uracil-DNA glycosylase family 4
VFPNTGSDLNDFYRMWDDRLSEIESFRSGYKGIFVQGEGPLNPPIMIISDAPGVNETYEGRPFRGPAKEALEELLQEVGVSRNEVFVTNLFKYEPSRKMGKKFEPKPYEMQQSARLLGEEIELVNPNVIIYMGKRPCSLMYPGRRMADLAGKFVKSRDGRFILFTFSPAVKFQTSQDSFDQMKSHMRKVRGVL